MIPLMYNYVKYKLIYSKRKQRGVFEDWGENGGTEYITNKYGKLWGG